jgi:hypothetical protein
MPEFRPSQFDLRRRLRRLRRAISGVLRGTDESSVRAARAKSPPLITNKTYNTDHPDYEPELSAIFPIAFKMLLHRTAIRCSLRF